LPRLLATYTEYTQWLEETTILFSTFCSWTCRPRYLCFFCKSKATGSYPQLKPVVSSGNSTQLGGSVQSGVSWGWQWYCHVRARGALASSVIHPLHWGPRVVSSCDHCMATHLPTPHEHGTWSRPGEGVRRRCFSRSGQEDSVLVRVTCQCPLVGRSTAQPYVIRAKAAQILKWAAGVHSKK
jgi:hypothetical protein